MTASMTSFGRIEETTPWGHVIWEIRTVNHRYLEINLRLPEEFRQMEAGIRERISQSIKRGKVDCQFRFEAADLDERALNINQSLASKVAEAASAVQASIDNAASINPMEVLRWPGVIERNKLDVDNMTSDVLALLDKAMDMVVDTRKTEGEKLKQMILERCQASEQIANDIRQQIPAIMHGLKDKLKARIEELCQEADQDRLEQELAYLAQKYDVAEELDRLAAHISEVSRVLNQGKPAGRRLDFLMQELNREANTLGSKAADIQYTNASVELKVLIEQMREQIQNIE